ncbi:MAG: FdhF/YdeP family oxidoreductase [Fimbriimonas sp.]|nr:FdhF/YdeP family oxidoreductase [Fimbriimonas sp.]
MNKPKSGGGWQAIRYTLRKAGEVGPLRFWNAMSARNACKTCAFGMGGQLGGMRNEAGHFPEVCKKSVQAMASDMQGRIEPRFFETYSRAELTRLTPRELETMGRLVDPVFAGPDDTHYRIVSWEEAFQRAAESLKSATPERTFFYASGRSSNEAGFLLQILGRALGTNHVSNCSYYCHQASGAGLSEAIGTATATVSLDDVADCDTFFLIGGNPASNHPRLMTMLMKLRRNGGKVIVVNPVKETGLVNFRVPSSARSMLFGTEIASTYIQNTIGGDIALLAGIAKWIVEHDKVDRQFVEQNTERFEEIESFVRDLTWERIVAASGVDRAVIESVAVDYAGSKRAILAWTMGITHHEHGVQNVQWIVNLALLRGMIGKHGAGVLPIRGHSNVQGMGSVGVSPAIGKAVLAGLEKEGLTPPTWKGYDTLAAIEASARGEMDVCLCLGGNLFGANPDANFATGALAKIGLVVYMNTTLNTGHVLGLGRSTLILPVLARDEEPQPTTQESMFSYVRLSDGGERRHEGPKSEVEILAEIAFQALGEGGPLDWRNLRDHEQIRRLISRVVPGMENLASISETKREFQIPGRILNDPQFKTASGKAKFFAHPIPDLEPLGARQLRLMTVRSEGQFNTVVYEEKDIYRGQDRRDVILMNGADIARLGLSVDQLVTVQNEVGAMPNILVREFDIAPGCTLMYYPEANVLVSRRTDPKSKTPAFKNAIVSIVPQSGEATLSSEEGDASAPEHVTKNRSKMRSC